MSQATQEEVLENNVLQKVFNCTLTKINRNYKEDFFYLKKLASEKNQNDSKMLLNSADLDSAIIERVSAFKNPKEECLMYFSGCYKRASDSLSYGSMADKVSLLLPSTQKIILDYSTLIFLSPGVFDFDFDESESGHCIVHFLRKGGGGVFFEKLLEKLAELAGDQMEEFFGVALEMSSKNLIDTIPKYISPEFESHLNLIKRFSEYNIFLRTKKFGELWAFPDGINLPRLFTAIFTSNTFDYPEEYIRQIKNAHQNKIQMRNLFSSVRDFLDRIMTNFISIITNYCTVGQNEQLTFCKAFSKFLTTFEPTLRSYTQRNAILALLLTAKTGIFSHGKLTKALWTICALNWPIKLEKIYRLSPFYFCHKDPSIDEMFHKYNDASKLGTEESLKLAYEFFQKNADKSSIKFSSHIFWIGMRSFPLLLRPISQEVQKQFQTLNEADKESQLQQLFPIQSWLIELLNKSFLRCLTHTICLGVTFLTHTMFGYTSDGEVDSLYQKETEEKKGLSSIVKSAILRHKTYPSEALTPQFSVLPSNFPEDLAHALTGLIYLRSVRSVMNFDNSPNEDIFARSQFDIFVCFGVVVAMHQHHFRNIDLRAMAVTILEQLFHVHKDPQPFSENPLVYTFLIPTIINCYIDFQKANYYSRLSYRLPILKIITNSQQKSQLSEYIYQFSVDHREKFSTFFHLLLDDLYQLVETAMKNLTEIKSRQSEAADRSASTSATENNQANENQSEDNVEEIVNQIEGEVNQTRAALPDLEKLTSLFLEIGQRSCELLNILCHTCAHTILSVTALVPHTVSCLNYLLDYFVGTRSLHIKVNNFEKYKFDPRKWLINICETYLSLASPELSDSENFIREVTLDSSFFNFSTFKKATNILKRENLFDAKKIGEFNDFLGKLSNLTVEQKLWENMDDIPEEYLDPIMQDLMMDPVQLPTSKVIMDRKHIERHLMTEPFDPFNRSPLAKEDLIPQTELKASIMKYMQDQQNASTSKNLP